MLKIMEKSLIIILWNSAMEMVPLLQVSAAIRNGDVISDGENSAMSTLIAIMGRMATYLDPISTRAQALNAEGQMVSDEMTWNSNAPVSPDEQGNYTIPTMGVTKY